MTLAATLALPVTALAKKPANPGGGDDGGGSGGDVTVNPVPEVAQAPPITYARSEITWPHDIDSDTGAYVPGFEGARIYDVNNRGLAVGDVLRPKPAGAPEDWFAFRYGVINTAVDADGNLARDEFGSPVASDTWVDLNVLFGESLVQLNTQRTDGPWRIAYGRMINDRGMVACELVGADMDAQFDRENAASYGREANPCLIAIADLSRQGTGDELVLIDPDWTDPDQELRQLTPAGDVRIHNSIVDESDQITGKLEDVYVLDPLTLAYVRVTPDPAAPPYFFDGHRSLYINSSLQMIYGDFDDGWQIKRDVYGGDSPEIWWDNSSTFLWIRGIAEDGSLYVVNNFSETEGKGKNATTYSVSQPYHLLSPTVRTPLTNDSANMVTYDRPAVSTAAPGEEEVLLRIEETGALQLYKPNYGKRFELDLQAPEGLTVPTGGWAGPWVSSPFNHGLQSDADTYYGGYIAYRTNAASDPGGNHRTFILAPSQ